MKEEVDLMHDVAATINARVRCLLEYGIFVEVETAMMLRLSFQPVQI